jgi:hypothetical protein
MDGDWWQRYSETLAHARKEISVQHYPQHSKLLSEVELDEFDRPMFVVVVGFEDYGPEVYGPFDSMAEASQAADGWSFDGETREVEYITSREVKE